MLLRPGASQKAGKTTAPVRSLFTASTRIVTPIAVAAMAASALPATSQQVQDILKKTSQVYASVKTYEATISVKQSGKAANGKEGTVVTVHHLKYKAPGMFSLQIKISASGGGNPAKNEQESVYSDGTTLTEYAPALNQYTKRPAPPAIPFLALLGRLGVGIPSASAPNAATTLVAPTTVNGRAAYVVQVKVDTSKLPPTAPPQYKAAMAAPFFFAIDKQNSQLLKVSRPAPFVIQVNLDNQVINGSLAASAFHFTPPANAKLKPPTAPQPGMAPGGAPPR